MNYGLQAAEPVKWLVGTESEVYRAVAAFASGAGEPTVIVAGPPSAQQIMGLAKSDYRQERLALPVVALRMRKVTHHLTGEPGVEVTCTDAEMDEIARWCRESQLRKALSAAAQKLN